MSAYLLFKTIVRGYSLTKNIDFKYLYCHVIYVVSQSVMSDICDHSMDYSPPGSSIDGLLQVTILEWVAIPFSRGSSWPWDQTWVSCIEGRFSTIWSIRKAQIFVHQSTKKYIKNMVEKLLKNYNGRIYFKI